MIDWAGQTCNTHSVKRVHLFKFQFMQKLFDHCPNGCNSELRPTDIDVAEGVLLECSACGQLVTSCSREYYDQAKGAWSSSEVGWPSGKELARLTKRRSEDIQNISKLLAKKYSDINILDVGSSNGSFVSIANKLGLQAEGVDPSPKAIEDGVKRGLKLHLGYLHEVGFADGTFDAITLYEVAEHLPDPIGLLQECARILKPNGLLLIGTGNTDSWTRHVRQNKWDFFNLKLHGGHISFFSPATFKVLAAKTGFDVVKVSTSSVRFYEQGELPFILYRTIKLVTELLNILAKLLNKGSQMEIYLRKR